MLPAIRKAMSGAMFCFGVFIGRGNPSWLLVGAKNFSPDSDGSSECDYIALC